MNNIEILDARTEAGRAAIAEVMASSFTSDIDMVPPEWALARCVDGVPVAFALIDPDRSMQYPGGSLHYGFIADIATRKDRRWEGHFRALMEEVFSRLRAAGRALAVTHGRYPLYRRFGFDVFTYNSGILIDPDTIDFRLGKLSADDRGFPLTVGEEHFIKKNLLLVSHANPADLSEARLALQTAARLAREKNKRQILFEHPTAPSYGSSYPIYPSPETPLTRLARLAGGEVRLQGANPEDGPVPDADWIKLLDAEACIRQAVAMLANAPIPAQYGVVWIDTDAGGVFIGQEGQQVTVAPAAQGGVPQVYWPASALAQLVTGYLPVDILCELHHTPLPPDILAMLDGLFPPIWRFSRNESWTYTQ